MRGKRKRFIKNSLGSTCPGVEKYRDGTDFVFTEDPHGLLATVFSIFPLTAPASMLSRLVHGGVPAWQIIVSLVGLALTAYLFVALAARLFRADTFLSSSSLTWKRLWAELRNRPTA